ncbi:peptide-N4-(N-acetyl-beta-glucosaminyl)asparagine amidase A-like [Chenopodium quinoa]|uniref:peptide-N4-(N-acetyl-beta- glucosaminyl)asparagine amidase A-like n=1 Tax=Chenopodium quinoa TaxID=63459 RepID=UPI000B79233C|nr:peptide-N4-(N-acetyl-beta-glucosaminyl)asparagine amidase A-like [Chenopodium quinoa]
MSSFNFQFGLINPSLSELLKIRFCLVGRKTFSLKSVFPFYIIWFGFLIKQNNSNSKKNNQNALPPLLHHLSHHLPHLTFHHLLTTPPPPQSTFFRANTTATESIQLTPFLGSFLDGESHTFELGVANSLSFWLVDANLHVWVDKNSTQVEGMVAVSEPSEYEESREYKFKQLDGSFEIEAERTSQSSGWVNCSTGNFTTSITQKLKYKNSIEFQGAGTQKTVEQKLKVKTEVRVVAEDGTVVSLRTSKRQYPLQIVTSTIPGPEIDTEVMTTTISNELKVKSSDGNVKTTLQNTQESEGSMMVKDHSVLSGRAVTRQTLSLKGTSCFSRSAEAAEGILLRDDSIVACSNLNNDHNDLLSAW